MKAYEHRWHRPLILDLAFYARVVADTEVIVAALQDGGIQLCGPDGKADPVLTPDITAFNGNRKCGHPVDYRIARLWPSANAGGIAEPGQDVSVEQRGDTTLVLMRRCNGNCSHQGFALPRVLDSRHADQVEGDTFSDECATGFRPYDLAVTAVLLSVKHHFGDAVRIFSEGEDAQFFDAQILCEQWFDFGLEFEIVAGELVRKPAHRTEFSSSQST